MSNKITVRPRNSTLSVRVKNSTSPSSVKLKNSTNDETISVRVKTSNSPSPIKYKNATGVKSIEDIGDVDEINVSDGSTLIYNQFTDKYEIKKIDINNIEGDWNIDCGEF